MQFGQQIITRYCNTKALACGKFYGIHEVNEFLWERHWVGCRRGQWDSHELLPIPRRDLASSPSGSFEFELDGPPHKCEDKS